MRPVRVAFAALALAGLAACGGGGGGAESAQSAAEADGLQALPLAADGTRAVQLWPAGPPTGTDWCLHRSWPGETLQLVAGCASTGPVRADLPRLAQGELLALASWSDGVSFYLATYDARRNIPSGRLPGVVQDGVDIHRFDRSGNSVTATVLGTLLPLGGFDNLIHMGNAPGGFTVCAVRTCLTLAAGQAPVTWSTIGLEAYEFVEVSIGANGVEALLRSVDDGYAGAPAGDSFHYAHARMSPGANQVTRIEADCLPFNLAGGSWRCARTPQDMAMLLRADLARMPHHGQMDFGASNMEGRIAWSQAYYLTALAQLGSPLLPSLGGAGDWTDLRRRTGQELALLARRAALPGGYASRRYAMQRSELTFALHLGRIARTLEAAADAGHDSADLRSVRQQLAARLQTLDGTVEQPGIRQWQGRSFDTLAVRRGADFWCDGANVPYNYISAYVSGLLAGDAGTAQRTRSATLMAPLLALEPLPGGDTWSYWWGQGFDGWAAADDVSTNTPQYGGSRGAAHISYRSIDAVALLRLAALQPDAVPLATVQNLRRLAGNGGLLPWVGEELARQGRPERLTPAAAYRHARATGTWELQAQVWALERLASP
jgi:hypothetical protein